MKESKPYTLKEIWPIVTIVAILFVVQVIYFILDTEIDKSSILTYKSLISHAIILIIVLCTPRYAAWRIKRKLR